MASSFITKDNEHGFWIKDGRMQVICWGLVNVIDKVEDNNSWLKGDFRENMYNNSQGIFVGWMFLLLDEYLVTEERVNTFNNIIQEAKLFFKSKGEYISVSELNAFQLVQQTKSNWIKPLETQYTIDILNLLSDIVNDKITITASTSDTY